MRSDFRTYMNDHARSGCTIAEGLLRADDLLDRVEQQATVREDVSLRELVQALRSVVDAVVAEHLHTGARIDEVMTMIPDDNPSGIH